MRFFRISYGELVVNASSTIIEVTKAVKYSKFRGDLPPTTFIDRK
jgi:hypothetical protein